MRRAVSLELALAEAQARSVRSQRALTEVREGSQQIDIGGHHIVNASSNLAGAAGSLPNICDMNCLVKSSALPAIPAVLEFRI